MNPTKIAINAPNIVVANPQHNAVEIIKASKEAAAAGCQLILFPALCVTGATCGDLFRQERLLSAAEKAIQQIAQELADSGICIVFGAPKKINGNLYDCILALHRGEVIACVERNVSLAMTRWFAANGKGHGSFSFPLEDGACRVQVISRTSVSEEKNADIILYPDSMPTIVGSYDGVAEWLQTLSQQTDAPIVYQNAGFGESTTDNVFGGEGLVVWNGCTVFEAERFQIASLLNVVQFPSMASSFEQNNDEENARYDDFMPENQPRRNRYLREVINIQVAALAKRFLHTQAEKLVLGVSGGLDSTLAMIVCVETLQLLGRNPDDLLAVTMPGYGTSSRTYQNAQKLMSLFGADAREISIKAACEQHFDDIGHDRRPDVTFENAQARERTQILLDLAGMHNGIVVGTGDLTELALGFATYNGDHMASYGVNAGVPKTIVRAAVRYAAECGMYKDEIAKVLIDIVETPISPELLPPLETGDIAQKTEEIVGPYELNDFFLYMVLTNGCVPSEILEAAEKRFGTYGREEIRKQLNAFYRRFFTQQFKRSCLPDGPQVFGVTLSPRGGFVMPCDADGAMWQLV